MGKSSTRNNVRRVRSNRKPYGGGLGGAFSPLPDKIDIVCGAFGDRAFRLFSHRKHSHYWGYWLLFAVALFMYMKGSGLMLMNPNEYISTAKAALHGSWETAGVILLTNLGFWASVGSLLHIAEDFFSGMGVPLVVPDEISSHIKLYKTGSMSEMLFTTIVVAAFLFFSFDTAVAPYRDTVRATVTGVLFG